MGKSVKVWGTTECAVESDRYSRHLLQLTVGGYSSVHYHQERANRFLIASGSVAAIVWHGWLYSWVTLSADMTFVIPSLVVHQFVALTSGSMIEEYWPDRGGVVKQDDIVRLCQGGMAHEPIDLEKLCRELLLKNACRDSLWKGTLCGSE